MPALVPTFGQTSQNIYNPARMGCVDIWTAPTGTLYNSASNNKNGGWIYMGRIMPGSYKNDMSKTFFSNMSGTPATLKERFVTEVQGKIEFSMQEFTARAYQVANGSQPGKAQFITAPVATTVGAAPAPAVDTFAVASATGLAAGLEIEVALATGNEYTFITQVVAVQVDVFPRLSAAPASTNAVKVVNGWQLAAGGNIITYYAIRALFYTTDLTGIMTWAPKVSFDGIKDDFGDGKKIAELPLSCACHGFTDANFTGPQVAQKFIFDAALLTQLAFYA